MISKRGYEIIQSCDLFFCSIEINKKSAEYRLSRGHITLAAHQQESLGLKKNIYKMKQKKFPYLLSVFATLTDVAAICQSIEKLPSLGGTL